MRVRPDIGFQRLGGDLTRREGHDDGLLVIDPHAHIVTHDTPTTRCRLRRRKFALECRS